MASIRPTPAGAGVPPRAPGRSRVWLLLASVCTIALGLSSRKWPGLFPPAWGKYPGDALWALLVFFGIALLWPKVSTASGATFAFLIATMVEFSQRYQAPWINAVRHTTLGHLILGSAFSWNDLPAYAAGVGLGVLLDKGACALRRATQSHDPSEPSVPGESGMPPAG